MHQSNHLLITELKKCLPQLKNVIETLENEITALAQQQKPQASFNGRRLYPTASFGNFFTQNEEVIKQKKTCLGVLRKINTAIEFGTLTSLKEFNNLSIKLFLEMPAYSSLDDSAIMNLTKQIINILSHKKKDNFTTNTILCESEGPNNLYAL